MGDDLMGMLSDMSDPEQEGNADEKGMGDLLGSLLGGAGGSGDLGALLGGLVGSGGAAGGSPSGGDAGDLMGMLGGLMGGGASPSASSGSASSDDAGDLMGMLGGMMGGGATESAGSSPADAGGLGIVGDRVLHLEGILVSAPTRYTVQVAAQEHVERLVARAREALPSADVSGTVGSGHTLEECVTSLEFEPSEIVLLGSSRLAASHRVFLSATAHRISRALSVPMVVIPRDHVAPVVN